MKKYTVYYARITRSRCGSYIYKHKETIEAENAEAAKAAIRAQFKEQHNGQGRIQITKVQEAS